MSISIDTVNLWLGVEEVRDLNISRLPQLLSNATEYVNTQTGEVHGRGNLKNLRVSFNENGVGIKGSLCTYALGDNLQSLTRCELQYAIEMLSEALQMPVEASKVNRLDVGCNFIMDYQPDSYFKYLGDSRYFRRHEEGSSLYYSQKAKRRQKLFYDKKRLCKSSGVMIPEALENQNILRFEIRLLKQVSKQLGIDRMRAKDLYEESIYVSLCDKVVSEYNSISKINIVNFDNMNISTPSDFKKMAFADWVHLKGVNTCLEMVEVLRDSHSMSNKEAYSRLKRDIKGAAKAAKLSELSESIKELNNKINRLTNYYR